MKKVLARIVEQVNEVTTLLDSAALAATLRGKGPCGLLINNSFIERTGINTNKSRFYLYVPIAPNTPNPLNLKEPGVLTPPKAINVNQSVSSDLSSHVDLADAVKAQNRELGALVLTLIGVLDKSLAAEARVSAAAITTLRYDPKASQPYLVQAGAKTGPTNQHATRSIARRPLGLRANPLRIRATLPNGNAGT